MARRRPFPFKIALIAKHYRDADPRPKYVTFGYTESGEEITTLAPWFEKEMEQLSERDCEVIIALEMHKAWASTLTNHRWSARRQRQLRRLLPGQPPEVRRAVDLGRADRAAIVGRTRPLDALTELCAALSNKGLTAVQIVDLLDATGIEPRSTEARARVEQRVSRARKRDVRIAGAGWVASG